SGLHRLGVVDGHLDGSLAPALPVQKRELTLAVGQRVALAKGRCRAQRKLATGPRQHAAAANAARLERADRRARLVGRFDRPLPETAMRDSPARAAGLRG